MKPLNSLHLQIVLVVVSALGAFATLALSVRAGSDPLLTLHMLDVGQGDAIFIETPNGNQVLIDGGPDRSVLRELGRVMPFWDRSLDLVVVTHPDRDHIGGMVSVLERYQVEAHLTAGVQHNSVYVEEHDRLLSDETAVTHLARRGERIELDDGVYLDILYPDRDVSDEKPNEASVVMKLVHDNVEMLLTGDIEAGTERYLVATLSEYLDVEVLKVPHHGSKSSTTADFLAAVAPDIALISAGTNNRFGHPHAEVVERLEDSGAEVYGTYELGRITVQSDGQQIWVK